MFLILLLIAVAVADVLNFYLNQVAIRYVFKLKYMYGDVFNSDMKCTQYYVLLISTWLQCLVIF